MHKSNIVLTAIAAMCGVVLFSLTASATDVYYLRASDGGGQSSMSGAGSPPGWATTPGGAQVRTDASAPGEYVVDNAYLLRTADNTNTDYTFPGTTLKVVNGKIVHRLAYQQNKCLTINDLVVPPNGYCLMNAALGDHEYSWDGHYTIGENGKLFFNPTAGIRNSIHSSVSGTGCLSFGLNTGVNPPALGFDDLDGDLSGFEGTVETYGSGSDSTTPVLQFKAAQSIPAGASRLVVTNGASVSFAASGTIGAANGVYFGSGTRPVVEVASGYTVTIGGDLFGTVGFTKTGMGTLVLRGAPQSFSGEVIVSAGKLHLAGDAKQLVSAPGVTLTEAGGVIEVGSFDVSPIPDQMLMSAAALQAGVTPSVTVSNTEDGVELVLGTDYTLAYTGNTVVGTAYAVVTGIGTYAGRSASVPFRISFVLDTSNYAHTMAIAPAAGRIIEALTNFPILVRLSTARQPWFDPADCAANGADLRFTLPDGTLLAHEIDTWNASGESLVWVNVPTLTASTVINAYWGVGDASLAPSVNPADTWPDFVAVYHLGEGGTIAYDSSANGYSATNAAAVSLGSNPKVGGCARITGTYDTGVTSFIDPSATKPLSDISRLTISAWVAVDRVDGTKDNSTMSLALKYSGGKNNMGGWLCRYLEGYPCFGFVVNNGPGYTGDANFFNWNTDMSATGGNWVYLTCAADGTTAAKYVNGALLLPDKFNNAAGAGNPRTFSHGILPDASQYKFGAANIVGRLDELRIRDGAASAAWVAADYAQQNDAAFLSYAEEVDEAFVVSPIPNQTVSTVAELLAGVTPSVTVSNLTTSTELTLGTDYTVTYTGNTSIGVAYAVVTGLGAYTAYTNSAPFLIGGIAEYFIVGGSASDGADNSTISGSGSNPTGWATMKDGAKAINGITAENAIYHVWLDRLVRTQPGGAFATPSTSAIVIEPSCKWTLGEKIRGNTLTLNNLFIRAGGKLVVSPYGDGNATFRNTYAGNWTMEEGSSVNIAATKESDGVVKNFTISATVAGRGAIVMPSTAKESTYEGTLANQITGNLTGFTGDIGTWNGYNAVSLELVNAVSLPGDPAPEEVAYVVVTNAATLKVDNNWVSPTNRIWILGEAGTPTIDIPSGTTVEINGDLVGSVGFIKTGAGTLVISSASPDFSGEITISAGILRLSGKAATLSGSANVTITESGGLLEVASLRISPIPVQTVYSLEDLAAGVQPTLVVSNLDEKVELVLDTDYTVAYSNNTTSGIATAIVTGINDYEGMEKSSDFIIHAINRITVSTNLTDDVDWTGFESISVVSAGVILDLKGHKLTITGLDGLGRITDTVGGGELHYYVPATYSSGYEAKIENVSLMGQLKLVKEGEGVLTAIKPRQPYTGGTVIDGGVLRYGCTDKSINDTYPFGYNADEFKGPIVINAGGVLDPAGSVGWGYHYITFNGGTVSNTVPWAITTYGVFNPRITVNADFTFATMRTYGWTVGELNGHTATVYVAMGDATLFLQSHPSTPPTSGCLNVVRGGYISTFTPNLGRPTAFQGVDFLCNAALSLQDKAPLSFRDYAANYLYNYSSGNAALNVYGTFTPNSDYFYGPVMQDGSAIDLSAKTGAWNVTTSLSYGSTTTTFASGATVTVELGNRAIAKGEKVISWTTQPDATFKSKTWELESRSDGLYAVSRKGGFMIIVK